MRGKIFCDVHGRGGRDRISQTCYSLWSNSIYLCGGKPVFYICDEKSEWNPDCNDIISKITNKTKAIVIINPNNPTGALYPNDILLKIADIARKNNVELYDEYTGFKWIAYRIRENEGVKKYIGGGEESFGFLPFDKVRDKDSPASICLICEIAAWAKDNGKTLYDLLMDIYTEYGFSMETTINVVKPGKSGADEIKQMMTDFRTTPPQEIGGSKVVLWKDYQTLEKTDAEGNVSKLDMPDTSNVLQWFCEDGTKISVRPSGTEPKIKFYIEIKDNTMKCAGCYERCTDNAKRKVDEIKKSLNL